MKKYPIPPNLHDLKTHQKIKIALHVYSCLHKPVPYPVKIGLTQGLLSFCALPSLIDARSLMTVTVLIIIWSGALAASITINEVIRVITR